MSLFKKKTIKADEPKVEEKKKTVRKTVKKTETESSPKKTIKKEKKVIETESPPKKKVVKKEVTEEKPKKKAVKIEHVEEEVEEKKVKATRKPKSENVKGNVVIKEIIREVPRTKKAPSAFNKFISDNIKTNKLSFKESIDLWNKQKAEKVEKVEKEE